MTTCGYFSQKILKVPSFYCNSCIHCCFSLIISFIVFTSCVPCVLRCTVYLYMNMQSSLNPLILPLTPGDPEWVTGEPMFGFRITTVLETLWRWKQIFVCVQCEFSLVNLISTFLLLISFTEENKSVPATPACSSSVFVGE